MLVDVNILAGSNLYVLQSHFTSNTVEVPEFDALERRSHSLLDSAADPIVFSQFSNIAVYLKYLRVYEATDKYHTA